MAATIAVDLAFAFVGGLPAVQLRLPPLVGYLLAVRRPTQRLGRSLVTSVVSTHARFQ
jgi:hypothetical protein